MKTLAAAAVLLLIAVPAYAQKDQPGDLPPKPKPPTVVAVPAPEPLAGVYDKALGPGWEAWPWPGATITLSADIGSARMPIKVEADGYKGLFLHHAPFSTAPYRGVSMLIQVVGGDAEVRVIAIADNKPIPDGVKLGADGQPLPMMKVIPLKPGGWTQVTIPLGQLGAMNRSIDGLWVQNNSGAKAPNIYVADVKFDPWPPAPAGTAVVPAKQ